jgi:hypothetical protein
MAKETKDADGGDRAPFAKGGSHSMHGAEGVGNQKPGVSSQEGTSSISSSGDPDPGPPGAGFYSSGATNKDYAGMQDPGTSGPTKSGGNAKWAEGGKTSMFGNQGSRPAQGGKTSAY